MHVRLRSADWENYGLMYSDVAMDRARQSHLDHIWTMAILKLKPDLWNFFLPPIILSRVFKLYKLMYSDMNNPYKSIGAKINPLQFTGKEINQLKKISIEL